MSEAQKLKGFRTPLTIALAIGRCVAAKLDKPGLVWVQTEPKLSEPLFEVRSKPFGIAPPLEAEYAIIRAKKSAILATNRNLTMKSNAKLAARELAPKSLL